MSRLTTPAAESLDFSAVSAKNNFHKLPDEFFPREKLMAYGSESLTNTELVAIFLRTGTKGRNVLEVASDLICAAGSLEELALMNSRQIANACRGIGMAKATTLAAAFELGSRAIRETARTIPMNTPEAAYEFLLPQVRRLNQEKIFVLILDTKMKLIACKEIAQGTLTECLAHPREILKPVLIHNAYGFILAHNHPSGDPAPSREDRNLTESIKKAAKLMEVPMLDHIIIGKPSNSQRAPFYSFRREKEL